MRETWLHAILQGLQDASQTASRVTKTGPVSAAVRSMLTPPPKLGGVGSAICLGTRQERLAGADVSEISSYERGHKRGTTAAK